ncbi:hypothetical protein JKP75_01140 [Blastococcus sp. TML/M2B]|nr:hypothetical protein [Blastococcus sp. TML/M2B]MBN1091321.1 hypothetical protein [Blastococcus sp. TML/M2B]
MLAADPAERPTMAEVRDELARLAAGRSGDTTTVLLARTDLRPAGGRPRTEVLPVAAAAGADDATAEPAPATPPPAAAAPAAAAPAAARPRVTPAPARRGRRAAWLAAALVALVIVGLVGFLLLRPDGDDGDPQAGSTPSSSAAPSSEATSSAAPSSEAPSSEAPSTGSADGDGTTGGAAGGGDQPADEGAPTAGDPAAATRAFFALVPGDLAAAHRLTSPSFQEEFPLERFAGFWDDFSAVQISDVQADGDDRATVDITYVRPDGSRETEQHELRFVAGADGRLLLDRDEAR